MMTPKDLIPISSIANISAAFDSSSISIFNHSFLRSKTKEYFQRNSGNIKIKKKISFKLNLKYKLLYTNFLPHTSLLKKTL